MTQSLQTYGSDGFGPSGRTEVLRLEGPYIPAIVRAPSVPQPPSSAQFLQMDALIDTGASDICIDIKTARRLGLQPVDTKMIGGVSGLIEAVVFAGILEVPNLHFSRIMQMYAPKDVVLSTKLLLGRSFLAHFIMTYNGPEGMFHFHNPSSSLGGPVDDE